MDVCGRGAAIFKILPVLVSFQPVPAAQEESGPAEEKNWPTKPALSACPPGAGPGPGLLSAGLRRPCSQPPEEPISSSPALLLPLFSSHSLFVVLTVSPPPPPPQSHFSWFSLDQRLREKQFLAPCLLLAWSFTSSSLTKWGRERLTRALSLGGGAILAEVVAVLSDLWKVPEHLGEARSSGYQLLSLVRAGLWEACGAMSVDGSRSCSHPALPRI